MKARIVDFLLENHVFSTLASFAVLVLAIATSSLFLLFVSGVMAYGWPFFYVYLLDTKEKLANESKASAKHIHPIPANVAAAH